MPINASIPLGVQPLQIQQQDPNEGMNALARMMQIRGLQDESKVNALRLQDMQRTTERRNKLDSLLGGFNGKPEELEGALLKGGFLDESTKVARDRREALKTEAEAEAKRIETAHKKVDLIGQTLGWVRQNPTLENATAAMQYLARNGAMTPEDVQDKLARFQADPTPQSIASFADMGFRAALQVKDQLPKYDTRNLGGSTQMTAVDPVTGQVRVVNSVQNTQSPDNAATNARVAADNAASRAQSERHHRENQSAGKVPSGYRQKADGTLEFIPGGPADPNAARRAAPTEDERKAAGWLAQATNAFNNMEKALKDDPTANKPGVIESIPLVPEAAKNMTRSEARQRFNQGASSFAEAALRAATGAGVNESEARQKIAELTPQWGDKPPTIQQKRDGMKVYLESLATRSGRANPAPAAGGATGDFGTSPDIDALLKKYGGK